MKYLHYIWRNNLFYTSQITYKFHINYIECIEYIITHILYNIYNILYNIIYISHLLYII